MMSSRVKKIALTAFGTVNIAVGVISIIFLSIAGVFSPGLKALDFFNAEYQAYMPLPLVLTACGILQIAGAKSGLVFTLFVSVISGLYFGAALFGDSLPVFVIAPEDPLLAALFGLALPLAGLVYFFVQLLTAGVILKFASYARKPSN